MHRHRMNKFIIIFNNAEREVYADWMETTPEWVNFIATDDNGKIRTVAAIPRDKLVYVVKETSTRPLAK